MAHDVFLSHSVKDKAVADAIVARLELESATCWIAPRDVVPGADWGESIINAIESSRIMILIFSQSANASPQIKREVERAVNKGVYVIPFRVDNIPPARSLEYFISSSQWMDAFSPPLERHLDNLAKTVKAVLKSPPLPGADVPAEPESKTPVGTPQVSHASVSAGVPPPSPPSTVHLSSRSRRAIIATIPVLTILGAAAWYLGHKRDVPAEKMSEPIQAEQQLAGAKPKEHEIPHDNTTNVPSAASSASGSRTNQEPSTGKVFVKAPKGPFGVWIDPQKWTQDSSEEDPIKITFNHKSGDVYAMVISERISVPMESLKKVAVANAKKVAPDVKIASEEKRVVKGKELLCLKLTGTMQGIPFIYYGYYYGGSEGTLQVVTYTTSNLFDEFKQDFDDFLSGIQIGQEPATGKVFVKARKGPFGVWIDPQKWTQDSSEEDPIKITFNHKSGDAYAMVISERISVPMESLKKVAVANAKKVAPDVKIASEEKRVVKGKELLCLKLTATVQGMPLIYYGYYYGGSDGTLQVTTYTTSNLFDEFKQDLDDFLNGTQIGQEAP